MTDIASLIGTLGFPIVCAIVLAYIVKYMFDKYTTDINRMQENHAQESKEFADALNKNTAILNKVASILHDLVVKLDKDSGSATSLEKDGDVDDSK